MKLLDLLPAERIVVPLEAGSVVEATRHLARVLIEGGAVAEPRKLERLLEDEWPEDIVAVGPEVVLPHFRTDAVARTAVALGIAREPICREHDPNRCARIVVLIVAPPRQAATYLQVLGACARLLGQPAVVERLLAARSVADVRRVRALATLSLPDRLQVRDIMTTDVLSVSPETPLREAAHLMARRNVHAVPVVGEGRSVIGMITDRELLKHLIPPFLQRETTGEFPALTAERLAREPPADPATMPVRDVMERSVLCLSEDQTVADAANLMVNKERDRFPVVRDGVLVGFLTRADMIRRLIVVQP